ncbi:hypothetical protein RMATCC62417_05398 [Rhizopus microsporus]|nr:hypothetical protein RMATCC62417_05398 [Rhizopus microsporus]
MLTFRLSNDQLPGKDQFSKKLLKTQDVIDFVVAEILEVPKGTYVSAGTEWNDGSRSDILYTPRLSIQKSLPPILIEIQLIVNEAFMQRLISYSQKVLNIYKTYPIVLIFCVDRASPAHLMAKFKPIPEKPWIASLLSTDFWAQSCFIMSKQTLSNNTPPDQLTPLQALSSFLTEGSPTLYDHPYAENQTIQQLYQISMAISENQVECDKNISNVVDIICCNNEKILMKADAALFGVPGSSKAKDLIKRGLAFNVAAKRKYCQTVDSDSDSDSSLEPLPKLKRKARETTRVENQDELEFVISYQKNLIGKMNWKTCLEVGHKNNLCQRYSTGESLRRFFYNASKK